MAFDLQSSVATASCGLLLIGILYYIQKYCPQDIKKLFSTKVVNLMEEETTSIGSVKSFQKTKTNTFNRRKVYAPSLPAMFTSSFDMTDVKLIKFSTVLDSEFYDIESNENRSSTENNMKRKRVKFFKNEIESEENSVCLSISIDNHSAINSLEDESIEDDDASIALSMSV